MTATGWLHLVVRHVSCWVVTCAASHHTPCLWELAGLEGVLVHRRLSRSHYLASPKLVTGNLVHPVGCHSTFVTLSCKQEENPAGAQQWKPVEGLLVLRLLMEQVPGKSRALKADDT